jgi:hypothetical protein
LIRMLLRKALIGRVMKNHRKMSRMEPIPLAVPYQRKPFQMRLLFCRRLIAVSPVFIQALP